MRKIATLLLLVGLCGLASADEITFSFIIGAPGSLQATAAGLAAGPSTNVLVSDSTTGQSFSLAGTFNMFTGPATDFTVFPTFLVATFGAAGADSVLITDPMGNPLVSGSIGDNATFFTAIPDGAGSFLGGFDVSTVSPAVLALFGLGPDFLPSGSVAATFAHDNFDPVTQTITGQLGGGTVTVTTPVPAVPEPVGLGVGGIAVAALGLRRRR